MIPKPNQLPLFAGAELERAGVPPEDSNDTTGSDQDALRRRVEVLEAWVRMVEGLVTGPMSALPTLEEADLQTRPAHGRR